MRTHPDDKLLEQHWYKSAAGLLQLVRIKLTDDPLRSIKVGNLQFQNNHLVFRPGQGFSQVHWYLDHFTFGIQYFTVKIG